MFESGIPNLNLIDNIFANYDETIELSNQLEQMNVRSKQEPWKKGLKGLPLFQNETICMDLFHMSLQYVSLLYL